MNEFLAMDGYGIYIWASYGIAVCGIAGLLIKSLYKRKKLTAEFDSLTDKQAQD